MNARLTPWLILFTILVVTLVGPATVLKDIQADDLTRQGYWLDLLAATIRAFAAAVLSAIALVAGVIGIPSIRGVQPSPPATEVATPSPSALGEGKS